MRVGPHYVFSDRSRLRRDGLVKWTPDYADQAERFVLLVSKLTPGDSLSAAVMSPQARKLLIAVTSVVEDNTTRVTFVDSSAATLKGRDWVQEN